MNLSQQTKDIAVPASAGAIAYALAREFVQNSIGSKATGALVAAVVASAGTHLFYQAADGQTRTALETSLLPLGAAGIVKIGLDRFESSKKGAGVLASRNRNLLTAAGAGAALYAFALRPSSSPAVGMLPPYQG